MYIELDQYRLFYEVAICQSITKAAKVLSISQPAVSKSIKMLESNMGIKLFERNSKGVKLTSDGKLIFEHVEKAIKELEIGERVIAKIKNKDFGEITIGVSTTLCRYYLLPYLKKFMGLFPHIKIKVVSTPTHTTLAQIEEEKIDLGIVGMAEEQEEFDFIYLKTIQDVFVADQSYLDSIKIKKPYDIFKKGSFMLLEPGNISRQHVDSYFLKNNIIIEPEIVTSTMEYLIEFAKIGLGVTCVIKDTVRQELANGELVEIPVAETINEREIGIATKKNRSVSTAEQAFISFMQGVFADL
ncbi:MAG: transcriptional regulator, LysR family [Clostridiales bacterium]|jgi:DNA-binding transcriptional LysR family regulator|nr:transcriptional regulator, LysR family [Clostridiales bacterium]